jgi:transposase
MAMAIVGTAPVITGGVDTHLDVHVAAAVDSNGGVLAVGSFNTDRRGYRELHRWLSTFGTIDRVGVEGTGAYGAGLSRYLQSVGITVIEVDRPNRQARRRAGKSDTLDAIEAARAALSGRAAGRAKTADGRVEAIRALLVAKRSARDVRIKTLNQIRHLSFTGPDDLRTQLAAVSAGELGAHCARLRPSTNTDVVLTATKLAIRTLGRRVVALDDEIATIDATLNELVETTAPDLVAVHGVGHHTAAILLVAAGDNAARIRTEAAWAHLCGVAPLTADSGKRNGRHRLNRGGNRQANHALWRIALTRMSSDARTRAYVERRRKEGLTNHEIMRVLKRYIAREVFRHLPR